MNESWKHCNKQNGADFKTSTVWFHLYQIIQNRQNHRGRKQTGSQKILGRSDNDGQQASFRNQVEVTQYTNKLKPTEVYLKCLRCYFLSYVTAILKDSLKVLAYKPLARHGSRASPNGNL